MPLYLRLTKLLTLLYQLVQHFPKQHKYSLGEDVVQLTWKMLDSFIYAQTGSLQKQHKLDSIRTIHQHHERLKLRVRYCAELKLISLKKQALLNQELVEIGKMIGSWLKHV